MPTTVEEIEKTIENKLKVLKSMHESTETIAGSKPINLNLNEATTRKTSKRGA